MSSEEKPGPAPHPPRWTLLGPAAVLLVTWLVLLPSTLFPYGRDQAVFAAAGKVIAGGGMPYRDFWDIKPPGVYLIYAALAWISPDAGWTLMAWLRAADLLAAGVSSLLMAALLRRMGRPEAAVPAAVAYAGLYLCGTYWGMAQAESWANPLVLGACLLLAAESAPERRRLELVLAGALVGAVALLKFTSILPVAPFLLEALLRAPRGRFQRAILVTAGLAVPLGAAVLWLVAGRAWEPYLDIQRGFLAPYARLNAESPTALASELLVRSGLWLWRRGLIVLLAALGWWLARRQPLMARCAWSLLCGYAAVVLQHKYFSYHWHGVLPWMAVLAGCGTVDLLRRLPVPPRRMPALGLALLGLWLLPARWADYEGFAAYTLGLRSEDSWMRRFGRPYLLDYSFAADAWTADYIRRHTAPGDVVVIWGFEVAVHLLADRYPPGRIWFNVPVAVEYTPPAWRREYLDDLRRRPPELFVVAQMDAIPWATGEKADSAQQLAQWKELNAWVRRHYEVEARVEHFTILRRKPTPHARVAGSRSPGTPPRAVVPGKAPRRLPPPRSSPAVEP